MQYNGTTSWILSGDCVVKDNQPAPKEVAIQDIWLMREGGENGLAYAVVYVQRDGIWYEAIRELIASNFSHCISANGLVSESCKPAAWLNKPESAQERS